MKLYTKYSPQEISIIKSLSPNVSSFAHSKLLEISKNITILNSIPKNILDTIIKDIKILKYRKDEVILEENSNNKSIFYILKGSVIITKGKDIVTLLKSENIFGEITAILDKPRKTSVISNESNTTIISFKINFNLLDSELSYYFALIFKNLSEELTKKLLN